MTWAPAWAASATYFSCSSIIDSLSPVHAVWTMAALTVLLIGFSSLLRGCARVGRLDSGLGSRSYRTTLTVDKGLFADGFPTGILGPCLGTTIRLTRCSPCSASGVAERPAGSSTVQALDAGTHFIGKKVLEEAGEVWLAAEHGSDDELAEEISQLLYWLQVAMLDRGLTPAEVYRYL